MPRIISWPKNNIPVVSCSMLLYEHHNAYMIDSRISFHEANESNVTLARSLVLRLLPTTWWIISKIVFAFGCFIYVHVGLTEKYLSNVIKYLLNSEPSWNITLYGLWYLDSHNSLNIRDILAGDLLMIGNFENSNHPVAWTIKVTHNNWSYFVSIYCHAVWILIV